MRYVTWIYVTILLSVLLLAYGCTGAGIDELHGDVNGIKADVKSQVDANAELKASVKLLIEANNRMELKLGSIQARIEAIGQAGVGNKVDSSNAGRDLINYLPKQAVDMLVNIAGLFSGITLALIGLFSTALTLAYRAAAQRERLRAQAEREERQATHELLVEVLASLPGEHSKAIQTKLETFKLARRAPNPPVS